MDRGVELFTPRCAGRVGRREIGDGERGGDHKVGLHVTDEVLDQSLRLGVLALAEIWSEGVVGGEADVVRRGDHHVGDHPALETAHAIGQHGLGDPAHGLKARGQRGEGGLGPLVVGEEHEAPPAPRHHRAEHAQRTDLAPVDDQHVPRRPHARSASPMVIGAPRRLRFGHQAAEVPG